MGLSELEESSLQIDETLLRFMEQLELLEEKRATLNSLIEQGWFSMSKARYSMGNKQVSALQYAREIEPLVCVHARTLDNSEVDFCTERVTQTCNNESARPVEDIGPQEEGVRRRIKSKKDSGEKENSDNENSEKPSTAMEPQVVKGNQHSQDPLKWFGILVPQSLKQAQSSFKQVIELSADIASLQSSVVNTREELKLGMKQKRCLQEKTSAAQLDKVTD
ncbi:coiled-coil domain-containing protein 115 [Diretmus argenteus]